MNFQIKKVIVNISSLGSTLSSDHLTVHVYASNEAEKLLVGRLDFVGKTDSVFKSSLNVICPDGFELSAIAVDEFGALHPFNDRWGIAVADDLYFPRGGVLPPEKAISKELSGAAGRDAVQAIVGRYLTGEATEYAEDMIDELMALRSVRELVIKTSIDASELQSTIDEVLDSIRKSDVFKILSGQGIEKPKSDGQQQVVFDNDQHRAGIIANATSLIEAMNAAYARQEAMMIELASARAAITESINQAVNDAIANALKPGGLLYARK
ncbi:hypothetical protein POH93_14400 [Phytobacter diazotrophicus]|uniref:hypothetical protein n=1 Tax=Phytobacter diazotrophicus TaxID=395631 RepID=UPI0023302953|nr:hypothetical protein [Phytobacter diazotrophicus]MDC0726575.1 hypothetical protein [Phytobacter diazotrophicus]MDC0733870.1 hypothetical protein [Phytobacter diazotrophicus]